MPRGTQIGPALFSALHTVTAWLGACGFPRVKDTILVFLANLAVRWVTLVPIIAF